MQRIDGRLVLSPTDLTKHVACAHITTLDLMALDAPAESLGAKAPDDALNLVFAKGITHERDYLDLLRDRGLRIAEIDGFSGDRRAAEAATVAAMRQGVDVVYQATLFDGGWIGHADFLVKVSRPSSLGGWSYDIADTKLARRLKVPALLQMAAYAERLEQLQGAPPAYLVVVTGDKREHSWRLIDVAPYAGRRRAALERAIAAGTATEARPSPQCSQCRWQARCQGEWEANDDLVLVAGMRGQTREALRDNGIQTVVQLAESTLEDVEAILTHHVARRVHPQAKLQVQERVTGEPAYLLLPPEPGRGLQRLPQPSPGDVYLDFEGDPWAEDGRGREYLAGIWDRQGAFTSFWAHDAVHERQLTERLVDELTLRWRADPGMHIYHYASYERTALQRLTGQYGTKEAELDQLLRAERLVDLYAVVRQSVQISKSSYSIKELENFYWGHTRSHDAEVADAMTSVVEYERWLVERDQRILDAIGSYNQDDVRSTHDLHRWLEERRAELEAQGHVLGRHGPVEAKEISDEERSEAELAERLVAAGHQLLAGCVGWHRREARPGWWDFFRYADLDTPDLIDDASAIGRPGPPERRGTVARSTVWRYPFPPQDCKVRRDKYVNDVDSHENIGKVLAIDAVAGWVDLSMATGRMPVVPRGFAPPGPIVDNVLRASIAATGHRVLDRGDGMAARLLAPVVPSADVLTPRAGEQPLDVVVRAGLALAGEVLAVQGPPGTGKTHAAAALIRALLDAGKRVGVTAQSHAVIGHVLEKVERPALQKVSDEAAVVPTSGLLETTTSNDVARDALASGRTRLVGGTAWLWARPDMRESVDVLVIDEAGQFSLANAVAVAPAAGSLVLLGDPQQLTQPTQAAHPFGAGVSALGHLIGDHDTIPADRGVFLGTTWRMHPEVTRFVSDLAYEGRLGSAANRENQAVLGEEPLAGSGLRWVPVLHDDCGSSSPQEVEAVTDLVKDLLTRSWQDCDQRIRPLTEDDILVVAPFNAHVAALVAALPAGVQVGTVDKFQGKEAPVVIYSMASSTATLAPRGVDFLFDVHRLNVAVSRARALSIVVGSPALMDAAVHSPEQLRAVNALCRYVDEATMVVA
jgi:predicted RecB family nuclease